MRGGVAKCLKGRHHSKDAKYIIEEAGARGHIDLLTGKIIPVPMYTILLHPECGRAEYKRSKRAWKLNR